MLGSRKVVPGRPLPGSLRFCNPAKWGLGLSWPWAQGSLCVQMMAISMLLTGKSVGTCCSGVHLSPVWLWRPHMNCSRPSCHVPLTFESLG